MKMLLHLHLFRRRVAVNVAETTDHTLLVDCASNARALSGEEWELISPWGEFPNDKGLQRLNPAIAGKLVTAFNSLAAKAKNLFRGIPIYVGHPDVKPEIYTDHRRYGKLEAVRVGADGLEGKIAWNDLGEQNQKQGYFVYPSVVWFFKRVGNGVIEPSQIASIGLTNTPNIPGVKPWSKNDRDPAAQTAGESPALNAWASRRASGVAGEKNPKAARARALMKKKKAGSAPAKPLSGKPARRVAGKGLRKNQPAAA